MDNKSPTRLAYPMLGILIALLAWQLLASSDLVSDILLPHPSKVFASLCSMGATVSFWSAIGSTVGTWILASGVGIFLGVLVGFPLGYAKSAWAMAEPVVEFFRCLPSVVLVPMVAMLVGSGASSRFISTAVAVCLIMIASSAASAGNAKASYSRLACTWKLSEGQAVYNLYLPSTLSHVILATQNAVPIGLVVSVAADMLIGTENGLGKLLMDSLAVFDTAKFFATVLVIGACGYSAAIGLRYLENATIHWRTT